MSQKTNNYKLEFTLKQHTPIIHFQSEQKGATLRATELKPKLDRFLIERFKQENVDYKPFLIAGQDGALDYKVKIVNHDNIVESIEYQALDRNNNLIWKKENGNFLLDEFRNKIPVKKALPMFFANMGDDWDKNPKQIILSQKVRVNIISYHSDLLKEIQTNFDEFIFKNNFGMRQSKGFGSFTVDTDKFEKKWIYDKNSHYKIDIDLNNNAFNNIYPPKVSNPSDTFKHYGKLFEILNIFSKTYRSGINLGGYYFKSLMYCYAKEKLNYVWDKKYFKSKFLGINHNKIKQQNEDYSNPNILNFSSIKHPYLLRDLLGLSTEQQWGSYGFTIKHLDTNSIKRYKSPVTFKIEKESQNKYFVYLIVNEIDKKIFHKCFQLTNETQTIKISTPRSFSLDAFFEFCFTLDIDKHAEKRSRENEIINATQDRHHKTISAIYAQLKLQVENKKRKETQNAKN